MCRNGMNRVFALVLLMAVCTAVEAASQKPGEGTKKLTLHPAGQAGGAAGLHLLAQPQEITDGDAFVLYKKAIESLPKGLDWSKIKGWRQVPIDQLPRAETEPLLQSCGPALRLLEQAGRCKRCEWPVTSEGEPSTDLTACRNLVFLVALKARSELARGDYASCVRVLGTGLALARHLGAGPTFLHVLVGVAAGAVLWAEVELYIQQPGAPSLEAGLRAVPKPLFDEQRSELYGMDEADRSKGQLLLGRANRQVIVLQYLEALRTHATKTGRWPQTLADLKAELPNDPVAGKPFAYTRLSDTQAILEGPLPKGGDAKDNVRYELDLVKKP